MRAGAELQREGGMVWLWMWACVGSCDKHEAVDASELQGTVLEPPAQAVPSLSWDDAGGTAQVDDGNGVQILQVAPAGPDRSPAQVMVVFDRPMVAISDLDSMNQAVPLSCSPEVGKARWAGTSTAVLLPKDGALPPGTAFTCEVPAGTKAIDGVALEKRVSWTFETPRPHVVHVSPSDEAEQVRLDEPVELVFDQPVDPAKVEALLRVVDGAGKTLRPKVSAPDPARPQRVKLDLRLTADSQYKVELASGLVGKAGPLPAKSGFRSSFRTFPPLRVENASPNPSGSPSEGIELWFSTSVPEKNVAAALTITPTPAHWEPPDSEYGWSRYVYQPALRAHTRYTVRLSGDLKDEFGQKLGAPFEWSFETGDYEPWIDAPSGLALYASNNPKGLPFKSLNASSVDAYVATIDPRALTGVDTWYDLVSREVRGPKGAAVSVGLEQPPNHIELDQLDLGPFLPGATGWVATELSAPNILDWSGEPYRQRGLLVITDLGATMKVTPGATELWVTSLATGQPVNDVRVELFVGDEAAGQGRTDANGLVRIEGAPKPGWEPWSTTVWARLTKGADVSVVTDDWDDGFEPWSFGIYSSGGGEGRQITAHGFADRGVYRLGEPVYARLTLRVAGPGGLLTASGAVDWHLEDPNGQAVANGSGKLDDRGGVSVTTELPKTGNLGDWALVFDVKGPDWTTQERVSVPVKAYRAPAFRVEVNAPATAVMGEEVTAKADARYLFGASMRKGQVHWRAWTEDRTFAPERFDEYSFGPEYRWWEEDEPGGEAYLSGDQSGALTDGVASFTQKVEAGYRDRPVDLFLEAEVTDVDRQVIAKRGTTRVHPAAFYLGVKAGQSLGTVGTKIPVDVVAVDLEGEPASAEAEVVVLRRDFNSVRERGMDGRWRWVNTPVDEEVAKLSASPSKVAARVSFKPEKPGYYVVRATGKDAAGHPVSAESSVYVLGSEYVGWGRTDDNHVELVPDKKKYAVGDVARILVKSPVEKLRALVTVEREGVLHREVVTLATTSSTIEVPIVASYRPNVYVSVVAVQGAGPQDGPDKGAPQVLVGLTDLTVDAKDEHLQVKVAPAKGSYGPRDTVEVDVAVTRAGKAVAGAGVTLFAVDESVLMLTDYATPDAYEGFYAHRGLSVTTADARTVAVDRAAYLTKGAPRGGGGGLAALGGTDLRSRFVTTVTWQPDLRTGPDGKVHAKFELPDNLTTFRVMAVVDAGAASFGAADAQVLVNRPLMVRPALPRLMRTGDLAYAGVIVHNNTTSARWVKVEAAKEGSVELAGSPVDVQVPANGAVEVPFKITALEAGTAKLGFKVTAGDDVDGLEWPMRVERDVVMETVASSGRFDRIYSEQIARPDGASPSMGGLTVDLASTALVGAGSGLEYLRAYPHECLEQRTSRALATLAMLAVRERAGIALAEDVLRKDVQDALASITSYQAPTGGLAYWAGSTWPSAYATAYGVELMGRAREAGFAVDTTLLDASVAYLRDAVTGARASELGDLPPQAELVARTRIALALARAGAADAGLTNRLWDQRRNLNVFGTASLLEVLARTGKPDARQAELASAIVSRSFVEAASASVREQRADWYERLWGSDDLSTAAALEALTLANQQTALLPRYALHLAGAKEGEGRWANTRATAAVLLALATYAQRYEAAAGTPVQATLSLAGAKKFADAVPMGKLQRVDIGMSDLANGMLELGTSGGPLYYEARMSYAPTTPPPRDEGFTLLRSIEPLDPPAGSRVTAGATYRVTLTVVTPTIRHDVAVRDPIPAGFEPVDSSLATASQAPSYAPDTGLGVAPWGEDWDVIEESAAMPDFGGSAAYDHHEIDDAEVRLYASTMPAGIHTYRYVVRATSPGRYAWPPARVEEMYEPENFGRTKAGTMEVAAAPKAEE